MRSRKAEELAALSGAEYRDGELLLRLLDCEHRITHPELVVYELERGQPAPAEIQALLLDYLRRAEWRATATEPPPSGEWLAFRELPEGQFYYRAFQGYSGDSLVRAFGNDLEGLKLAALALGGEPLELGDAAFAFRVLPHIRMAVVYWRGDEEFAPRATVLFDAAAGRYLPIDGLAILGRMLCSKLIKIR
ncbi:MAG: DUF3786 domain-containing protein [Candidatus Acetothermia bacterium]|nr:DUF3786 domain-containing protein [Candidatus Acetothermia bacterium]MDH7505380.1 DUF3786 domain-containing protein [Candidatus Acetothermia bacterium]